jgi:hypothetical protein
MSHQKQDSPRRPPTPRRCTLYRTCSLELCGMIVNHLPLAYKRRRRFPGRGGNDGQHTHLHAFRLHRDIGILPQSNLRDLEALPPLPPRL